MTTEDVISAIIEREGGDKFTNAASDPGGATKYGITAWTLGEYRKLGRPATPDEVRELSEIEAREIYRHRFLVGPGIDTFGDPLRWVLMDCAVLHGPLNAIKMLQRSIGTKPDGKLGPVTITAAKAWNPVKLCLAIQADRIAFLGRRITKDLDDNDQDGIPDNAEYAWGHMNRVADQLRELVA